MQGVMSFMTHTTQGEGSFPSPTGLIGGDPKTFLFLACYFAHQLLTLLISPNSVAVERVVGCYLGLGSPIWQGSCVGLLPWVFVFWELTGAWVPQDLGLVPRSRESIAYFFIFMSFIQSPAFIEHLWKLHPEHTKKSKTAWPQGNHSLVRR